MTATYTASEVADLLGVSEWAVYQAVKNGTFPAQPIRIGRRIVFARTALDQLLGIDQTPDAEGPQGCNPGALKTNANPHANGDQHHEL